MNHDDKTIENLLDLNGDRFVVDEKLGLWVKFEARRTTVTNDRPHGVRYSLTLHDKSGKRILGFDNAHAIEYERKGKVKPKRTYYHWHKDVDDVGRPYEYRNAGNLLEDFWKEVEKVLKRLQEERS